MRAFDIYVIWEMIQMHNFKMGSQSIEVAKTSLAGFGAGGMPSCDLFK